MCLIFWLLAGLALGNYFILYFYCLESQTLGLFLFLAIEAIPIDLQRTKLQKHVTESRPFIDQRSIMEVPSQRGVRVLGIRVGSSHWILLCVLFRAMWIYYYLFRKQNVSFQTFSTPISIQPAVISSFVPHCFPVLTLLTQRWSCPSPPFFFFSFGCCVCLEWLFFSL